MELLSLIATCAPLVAPEILTTAVQRASQGQPWEVCEVQTAKCHHPRSAQEAKELAGRLLGAGVEIKAGLTQVPSSKWAEYGLSLKTAFDPCRNLAAGELVVIEDYLFGWPPAVDVNTGGDTRIGQSDVRGTAEPAPPPPAPSFGFERVLDGFGD